MAGPSNSDGIEDSGKPDGAVRRDSCGGACDHADYADHAVDATTGPSDSRCAEDRGRPDCPVHRQSREVDEFLEVVKDIPPRTDV